MTDDPHGWTVLIVDDDEDNLSVLQQFLDFLGCTCHTARQGIEALEMLDKLPITLVLLDLSMPKLDGWQMIKELRAAEKIAGLPVIAVTAHAMEGDKVRALAAGFDGYISKPFLFVDMLQEIKRVVTAHGAQKESKA
jgi:two-component system, cell cycle response regulator DivK